MKTEAIKHKNKNKMFSNKDLILKYLEFEQELNLGLKLIRKERIEDCYGSYQGSRGLLNYGGSDKTQI